MHRGLPHPGRLVLKQQRCSRAAVASLASRGLVLLACLSPRAGFGAEASTTAAPPPPLATAALWHREWPTFSWWEGAATVAAGAGTLLLFSLEVPTDPRWEGGILFDDAIRAGLRADSKQTRETVLRLGDIPYFTAPLLPLLVDPLIVAWAVHGDSKAAVNMVGMGLQAFSYTGFLSFVSTRVSRRERPDSRYCRETGDPDPDCQEPTDTESFWSGHTSMVAASAGIVCANHRAMPLWGHPVADASACVLAAAGAATTGITRLVGDRHYATDVLLGYGVGFGIGYAVPTLLHYAHGSGEASLSLRPGPCRGGCLTLAGSF